MESPLGTLPSTVSLVNITSDLVPSVAYTENRTMDDVLKLEDLPEDMRYNAGHTVSIVTYSILLVVSAVGNISVLCILLRRRRGARSRINTMLLHLAIADLLVTFILMPLEIAWAATVSWNAGDAACRIMAFFRTFGLFLSGFVLACISIDRYFAVLKPLMLTNVDRRGKVMLSIAWMASVACSLPQVAIFHVERHPKFTWFEQCVTFNSFPSNEYELTYSLFGMVMMYGLPLVIITFSYISILAEIFRRSRDSGSEAEKIRRSSLGYLGKAKIKTLKMTVTIVLVFIICWTPYNVMCLWYWLDRPSALLVDLRVQKALFLFACTNSCANPMVYGAFNIGRGRRRRRGRLRRSSRRSGGMNGAGGAAGEEMQVRSSAASSYLSTQAPSDGSSTSRYVCGAGSSDGGREDLEGACLVSWRKKASPVTTGSLRQGGMQPGHRRQTRLQSPSTRPTHSDISCSRRREMCIVYGCRETLSVPGHI